VFDSPLTEFGKRKANEMGKTIYEDWKILLNVDKKKIFV